MKYAIKIGVVHIKKGVRQPEIFIPANSWVKQMAVMMHHAFGELTQSDLKDVNGNIFTTTFSGSNAYMLGLEDVNVGNVSLGIRVGLSSATPTRDDFNINSLIGEGTGLNQMNYGAQTPNIGEAQSISGGYVLTLERNFTNNSSGAITINELDMVVRMSTSTTDPINAQILHDLAGAQVVNAGDSVIMKYHLEFK